MTICPDSGKVTSLYCARAARGWSSGIKMKNCLLRCPLWLGSVLTLTLATATWAQVQFPVNAPTSKLGEIAKYRNVDLWNNKELWTSQTELVEIQTDRFVSRVTSSDNPQPRASYFTREWQPCRTMQNSDQSVCAGAFKFPLQTGNKHAYEKLPWSNGNGHSSGSCEVKGEEKVTVPAGTFDAVRIECNGFWNRVFGGAFSGRVIETHWYAPKISRLLKTQYTDYNSGSGGIFNKTQTELTEFIEK